MTRPMFTHEHLNRIREQGENLTVIGEAVRVNHDQPDLNLKAGTVIVTRRAHSAPDGAAVVAVRDGEFVVTRAPAGSVRGLVLGTVELVEMPDER